MIYANKIFIWTVVFSFVLFNSILIWGQNENYFFKHLDIETGLSQNSVFSILQDQQGFIWFGTKEGLNRFDGYNFKVFKRCSDTNGCLGGNVIHDIVEGNNGDLWVGTDKGLYKYSSEFENFSFVDTVTPDGFTIYGDVLDIQKDKNGNLWLAVAGEGLFYYDTSKSILSSYKQLNKNGIKTTHYPWSICIDNDGVVWTGTHNNGIYRLDQTEKVFNEFLPSNNSEQLRDILIYKVFNYDFDHLIIGTANHGLLLLNKRSGEIHPLTSNPELNKIFVRTIAEGSADKLWIGAESGCYIFNKQTKTFEHLYYNERDNYSLSDNAIYSILKDRDGGMWLGTYFGGANYFPGHYNHFLRYTDQFKDKRIREICEDDFGNIWIGTENSGLYKYKNNENTFTHFHPDNKNHKLTYYNIHGLQVVDNHLWIGSFSQGIDIIDIHTGKMVRHISKENHNSLPHNDIFAIYKDQGGIIWIGTPTGAYSYNKSNDEFEKLAEIGYHFIGDIYESSKGIIWFATYTDGVFSYNPRTKKVKHYNYISNSNSGICYDKIISIFEDSKGKMWFSSEGGGICAFDEKSESFEPITTDDGLPNNVVYKILEDNKGVLWMSTNEGLCSYNTESKTFDVYTQSHGLISNQFNYKSGFKSKEGRLFFGGIKGLVSFKPEYFVKNTTKPEVLLTGFYLFNNEVAINVKDSPLSKSITNSTKIKLKYDQSTFTLNFAALSYIAPEHNNFAYMLQGYENDWIHLEKDHSVTYSNLPFGSYWFKLKASNSNGIWNDKEYKVEIQITPPLWRTKLAYLIYFIIVSLISFYFINRYKSNLKIKHNRKIEHLERNKEKEVYNSKIEFFTNIAHEIRTPLTLIKGPLELIIKNKVSENELNQNLSIMEKNTNRLLDLINQLLDFRSTEAADYKLNYIRTDISNFIEDNYKRFLPLAAQKGIDISFVKPEIKVMVDIDREAVLKIFSNLLNNAIKFASSKIKITILKKPQSDTFCIEVGNDGSKIDKEYHKKIFEPFYQIKADDISTQKTGSGIGLSLVKSLTELHNGSIRVDEINEHTIFCIELPIEQQNAFIISDKTDNKPHHKQMLVEVVKEKENKPQILIVEDHLELLDFTSSQLKHLYEVIKASNGKEAMLHLEEKSPDLIVSDIAMPEMDGYEFCKEVRSNIDYCHIPFILLTARTNLQSKMEGLEVGADAYIEKPFSIEYLEAQIRNLLQTRGRIQEAYLNSPYTPAKTIATTKADEIFLNKVTDVINNNISNESFDVDQLAEAMNMSRSSFHRKIKGVTDITPNDFIKLIRLKKAAQLLTEGEYQVGEISILVGFNSASYFAKQFQKQFGVLPKEFAQN